MLMRYLYEAMEVDVSLSYHYRIISLLMDKQDKRHIEDNLLKENKTPLHNLTCSEDVLNGKNTENKTPLTMGRIKTYRRESWVSVLF